MSTGPLIAEVAARNAEAFEQSRRDPHVAVLLEHHGHRFEIGTFGEIQGGHDRLHHARNAGAMIVRVEMRDVDEEAPAPDRGEMGLTFDLGSGRVDVARVESFRPQCAEPPGSRRQRDRVLAIDEFVDRRRVVGREFAGMVMIEHISAPGPAERGAVFRIEHHAVDGLGQSVRVEVGRDLHQHVVRVVQVAGLRVDHDRDLGRHAVQHALRRPSAAELAELECGMRDGEVVGEDRVVDVAGHADARRIAARFDGFREPDAEGVHGHRAHEDELDTRIAHRATASEGVEEHVTALGPRDVPECGDDDIVGRESQALPDDVPCLRVGQNGRADQLPDDSERRAPSARIERATDLDVKARVGDQSDRPIEHALGAGKRHHRVAVGVGHGRARREEATGEGAVRIEHLADVGSRLTAAELHKAEQSAEKGVVQGHDAGILFEQRQHVRVEFGIPHLVHHRIEARGHCLEAFVRMDRKGCA